MNDLLIGVSYTKRVGTFVVTKHVVRNQRSNSYGSTSCIRFEGIISAASGTPWCIYSGGKGRGFYFFHKEIVAFFVFKKKNMQ